MSPVAVIIGGAGEIGRALAHSYSADGYLVHLVDRAEEVHGAAVAVGGIAHRLNVAEAGDAAVLASIDRVDVLVNAVGVWPLLTLDELTPERWAELAGPNLNAGYFAIWNCRAALRSTAGAVVNIASAIALKGHAEMVHYAAAKAGVIGMTKSLALAFGPDRVRVNAVAPGLVSTERNEAVWSAEQRLAFRATRALPIDLHVADVVDAVRYLSSPASRAITGQTIVVDGGTVMH